MHKGGCRPDAAGDKGIHDCTYALLPHIGDFSSDTVIRAAYCINDPVSVVSGRTQNQQSFVSSSESNVIIETIKPAEDVPVCENKVALSLRQFEIKTLRVTY